MSRGPLALIAWGALGLAAPPSAAAQSFQFVDAATAAGLTEPTWCGRPDKPHLLESGGTGLALFDADADGDLDLYLVNGWRLRGADVVERGRDRFYRNRGDGVFEDATTESGLGHDGWGTGVAVGDVDGDGDRDLFVTNFGPDRLYLNDGTGRFEAVADSPGIDGWSAGAVLFDADADGDADLFVAGYIEATLDDVLHAEPTLLWQGRLVMLGPFGLQGEANRFFVNDGAGVFEEQTEAAGLEDRGLFYSFGVAVVDLDADLDLDLYVANDSNANYVYRNDGAGRFQEMGLWSGAALDAGGAAQAGMGVAVGDYDADLDPDLFVTNFEKDASTLYRNLGDCVFEDVSVELGLKAPTFEPLSWGTVLADFDLDADLDLFVANGHIYPQADSVDGRSYAQTNQLLEQTAAGFVDVSTQAGPGLAIRESSRGVAAGDVDGDGDIDLVIANVDATPTLLRNDSPRRGSWLIVDSPLALRVDVWVGGRRLVRHRIHGGSFVSVSDERFHFGLGDVDGIERVAVTWPDGSVEEVPTNGVDRVVTVHRETPSSR